MNVTTHNQPEASSSMPLWKQGLAFCLGLLSLFLGFCLYEAFGGLAAVLAIGGFCLIAQFLLMRGNRYAFLDLASVVILNCPLVCVFFIAGDLELMLLLMVTVGCSYVGAMLASIAAMWAEHCKRDRPAARPRLP
jgi:hypothetical protein